MTSEPTTTTKPVHKRAGEWRAVVIGWVAIIAAIAVTAHLLPGVAQEYAYSLVLAAMVYVPILSSDKRRRPLKWIGITLENWKRDLMVAAVVMAIVFPLFALGYHALHGMFFGREVHVGLPEKALWLLIAEHTLFIALPEEVFYRGWMQTVFTKTLNKRLSLLGGDIGAAVWLTSLFFALGHLAATPSPGRLAVFFPSLLFCWLRSRTGGLLAPIIVHGLSNVLMAVLNSWYY